MSDAPNIEPQPSPTQDVAVARKLFGSPGFVVTRDGANVELRIPAPDRAGSIFLNWLVNLPLVAFFGYVLFNLLFAAWRVDEDDVNVCGIVGTIFFGMVFVWVIIGATRRIVSALRRGSESRMGVTDQVLWCEPAEAPGGRYAWPVDEVWRIKGRPGPFWRRYFWLEIRSHGRPVVGLQIPCQRTVAVDPLVLILRHAIGNQSAPPTAQVQLNTEFPRLLQATGTPSPPDDPTVRYFGDDPNMGWIKLASYPSFADWQLARSALAMTGILARLGSGSEGAQPRYDLLVVQSQAEAARNWLANPKISHDSSHCPRCGQAGVRVSVLRRITNSVLHPLRPITLGSTWLYCATCRQPYLTRGW